MTQKPVFVEGLFTLRNIRSVGAAAIIEILIGSGIAGILIWHQVQVIKDPPPMPGPIVEFPQQPIPQPRIQPEPQQPQPRHWSEVPSIPTPLPAPGVQPVQPPSSPPTLAQPPAEVLNIFAANMLRAINARKVYPKISLMKGETGETVVSFDYVDGVVSGIHVDKSSGSKDLDQAAIQAVQRAALPQKPAELAGLKHFVFTLVFGLGN